MLCSGSPGPRMSASQLTYALSTWPELSEQERMARFMAALHVTRPGAAADSNSHRTADMLSAVLSGSPADGQPLQDAPERHAMYQGSPGSSLHSSCDTSCSGSHAGGTALLAASPDELDRMDASTGTPLCNMCRAFGIAPHVAHLARVLSAAGL